MIALQGTSGERWLQHVVYCSPKPSSLQPTRVSDPQLVLSHRYWVSQSGGSHSVICTPTKKGRCQLRLERPNPKTKPKGSHLGWRHKMPITEQFSYRNTHRDRGRGGNLSAALLQCPRNWESLWSAQSTSVTLGAL